MNPNVSVKNPFEEESITAFNLLWCKTKKEAKFFISFLYPSYIIITSEHHTGVRSDRIYSLCKQKIIEKTKSQLTYTLIQDNKDLEIRTCKQWRDWKSII